MGTKHDQSSVNYWVRSIIAGGFAGGVAKTAVAPLDRVKILFQTHNQDYIRFIGSWRGIPGALKEIFRNEGFFGLYRGHSLTLARAVPHAAIGYTAYEASRRLVIRTPEQDTALRRMITGSMAGTAALPFTYPFEVIRVRMALQTRLLPEDQRSVWFAIRSIYTEQSALPLRILHFYRGFAVSLLGTIPYRGGIFMVWETLKSQSRQHLSAEFRERNRHRLNLAIGGIAGATSQIVTYPLEVIRRYQQASGRNHARHFMGFKETVLMIWRTGGWKGFYAGLGVGLIKQVPMHSISLAAWQAAKSVLNI
ncbi:hypothetical protein FRC17_002197 [Serendipita sp. 399]|nr:hypothetical protein FRC17_002197 [Serendipita sp. 399]